MLTKKVFLAFLWLLSILGAIGLTASFTNSPTWIWETKPWVREIKHWPEPVVALVGDMPIYQSDIRDLFQRLPPVMQTAKRKSKSSAELLNIATITMLWREAAQSNGIFQSTYPSQHLEIDKDTILQTWVRENLFAREAEPTEAQIQSYIAQNPNLFTKRIIHYREDRYAGPVTGKLSQPKLISSRHGTFVYPGTINPPWAAVLLHVLPGQSTAIVPCYSNSPCRYTKEGKDDVKPALNANLAKQNARLQIMGKKQTDWLATYQKSHPVQIKRQDLIDKISL